MYNKFMKKIQKTIIIVIVSLFSSICVASQSEDLKKLKDLYEKNILTEDQYNEAIQKVISNSEEIIKLNDLFKKNILTKKQFNEAKEKVLQKIINNEVNTVTISNEVNTVTNNQKLELNSLDGSYTLVAEWIFIHSSISDIRKGEKIKFDLEIINNEVKSLIMRNYKTDLEEEEIKFSKYKLTKKEKNGNVNFKLSTSVWIKGENGNFSSKWNWQIIDKEFNGTFLLQTQDGKRLLRAKIIKTIKK